jgi:hypothetical protein
MEDVSKGDVNVVERIWDEQEEMGDRTYGSDILVEE